MKYLILVISVFTVTFLSAQTTLSGTVFGASDGKPIIGAYVYWLGNTSSEYTDINGKFTINKLPEFDTLVISFTGFKTLKFHKDEIRRNASYKLEESIIEGGPVEVVEKSSGKENLSLEPIQVEQISTKELKKAACCNLSESFETNPSVDVNFADAVTGSKRVRLLGLDGVYSLITLENVPEIRGLSSSYGLTSIPGPWINSIQLAKGVGSVVNGYESITGQINVELHKPMLSPKFHFNGYVNQVGRLESSMYATFKVSDKLSTMLFVHGNSFQQNVDANKDGFLDIPKVNQFSATNRWMFYNDKIESQFGVEIFTENRLAGQPGFDILKPNDANQPWGIDVDQNRIKAYAKIGVLPTDDHPERSVGFINKFSHYSQKGLYGLKEYSGINNYWYTNVIFQDRLFSHEHLIKLGGGFFVDVYDEELNDEFNDGISQRSRSEIAGGAFAEYTYHPNERFTFITGGRLDYNNLFGLIATPRLHFRYKLKRNLTWRIASGSGQRTPNALVDNSRVMASQRLVVLPDELKQEKAWNFGSSLAWDFQLAQREASVVLDAYHTEFSNMLVMDMDKDPRVLEFYNLDGRSFSSVAQAELNYELFKRLDLRVSYKRQLVRSTFREQGLNDVPFVAKGKFLTNFGYSTANHKWNFDLTALRTEPGRIAGYISSDFDLPDAFWRLNGQVTYKNKGFEVYLGGENLTGFTQTDPIISSDNPFSAEFDAANVWAPIFGRIVYLGVRYTLFDF